MKRFDVMTSGWQEYELLDSGEGRKLERFFNIVTNRPDPQALWQKKLPDVWLEAHAQFIWADKGERWKITKGTSESWLLPWKKMKLKLSFKGYKHVGVFPEQVSQWDEIAGIKNISECRVLNLFGYTGAASIVAAQAGAQVTHVDASKQTIETLKENMAESEVSPDAIRTIVEDALRYTKRLVERGEQFEVILMDPPAFGRGPKGEVWKIEEKLPELLALIPKILSPKAKLVILNSYAAGFAARTLGELLLENFKERGGEITYGDIGIQQKNSENIIITGIYSRWQP